MAKAELITDHDWERLSKAAWQARDHARIIGATRVGAAALSEDAGVFSGCNIEHRFRSHDVHAEVAALTAMVSAGHRRARAILIAAEREQFTPCGSCLDWIFELGGPATLVAVQRAATGVPEVHRADELMPHYPR